MKKNKKYICKVTLSIMIITLIISGCAEQKEDKKQDVKTEDAKTQPPESSPHAFLLGSETLYCIDLPTSWLADLSDARHLALYWSDKQEGDVCSLSVNKEKHDLGRKAQVKEEYDTIFEFTNGMVRQRQFYGQEGTLSDYGKDEKLVWQQVQYDVREITDAGQLVRNFQFEEGGPEYYWFSLEKIAVCVNVKNEDIKKNANEMLESIRAE